MSYYEDHSGVSKGLDYIGLQLRYLKSIFSPYDGKENGK